MLDIQTRCARHHHPTLFYRSWHIWGFPLASCRIGTHWMPYGWAYLLLDRSSSICGFSPTTPWGCVLTDGSTLLSSFQRAVPSIFGGHLPFIRPNAQCFSTPRTKPMWSAVYPLALICNYLNWGYICQHTNCLCGDNAIALTHLNAAFCWTKTSPVLRYFLVLMASDQIRASYRRIDIVTFASTLCLRSLGPLGLTWAGLCFYENFVLSLQNRIWISLKFIYKNSCLLLINVRNFYKKIFLIILTIFPKSFRNFHKICAKVVAKKIRLKFVREDNTLYRLANTLGW